MAVVQLTSVDGVQTTLTVDDGISVMRAATNAAVVGIVGECGGQMMCATCHVYVQRVEGVLPVQGSIEKDMLELAASPVDETSRLSCQLVASDAFSVLEVRMPETQV